MRSIPVDFVAGKLTNMFIADDVQKHQLGCRTSTTSSDYLAVSGVGNPGGGEMMYVKGVSSFSTGRLVHLDKDFNILDVPVTAATGRPVFVVISVFSATQLFGWVLRAGVAPVQYSVAATAGQMFAGAAGQATPTTAAGRQILNAVCLLPSSGFFIRPTSTKAGTPFITVNDQSGIYPGITLSGAGVPASTTVLQMNNDGRTLTLSANCTATGQVQMAFTHTGFGICHLEQPFVQGQIT